LISRFFPLTPNLGQKERKRAKKEEGVEQAEKKEKEMEKI